MWRVRRKEKDIVGLTLLFLLFSACTDEVKLRTDISGTSRAVIYGSDDRLDYYEHPNAVFQRLARESSVALVHESLLENGENGEIRLPAESMGEVFGLCPDERFWNQPAVAECSGTLVDDDLVLTAGHCVEQVPCAEWRFVLGYYYEASTQLHTITDEQVYHCQRVIAAEVSERDADFEVDYAWILLDRPVISPYGPAPVFKGDSSIERGASVTVVSYGAGLPVKIDSGGQVVDERPLSLDYFITTNDNFHGGSGAGVYDSAGNLRGIVARGEDDYILDAETADCLRLRTDSNDRFEAAEEATYIANALNGLCITDENQRGVCEGVAVEADTSSGDASEEVNADINESHRRDASCALSSPVSSQYSIVGETLSAFFYLPAK